MQVFAWPLPAHAALIECGRGGGWRACQRGRRKSLLLPLILPPITSLTANIRESGAHLPRSALASLPRSTHRRFPFTRRLEGNILDAEDFFFYFITYYAGHQTFQQEFRIAWKVG